MKEWLLKLKKLRKILEYKLLVLYWKLAKELSNTQLNNIDAELSLVGIDGRERKTYEVVRKLCRGKDGYIEFRDTYRKKMKKLKQRNKLAYGSKRTRRA